MSDETVTIARYHYRYQGEFARQVLEDAGIPSALRVDDAGGIDVGMAFVNPARLDVRREDEARAREALTDAGLLDAEIGE